VYIDKHDKKPFASFASCSHRGPCLEHNIWPNLFRPLCPPLNPDTIHQLGNPFLFICFCLRRRRCTPFFISLRLIFHCVHLLNRPTSAGLPPTAAFWGKFKPKAKEPDPKPPGAPMAVARPRLLTLAFGDMETLRMVSSYSKCVNLPTNQHINMS